MVIRAKQRLSGSRVAGPFSYDYQTLYASRLIRPAPLLSKPARLRLAWMDFYDAHGGNAALVCRHFGIARATFYRWRTRYDRHDLSTLEDRPRAPERRRRPTTPTSVIDLVLRIRDEWPAWSKYKIAVVAVRDYDIEVSASTVGRILTRYGRIEAVVSRKRQRAAKGRYVRKRRPKEAITTPGQLIQMDTKHLNLPWNGKRYHFEAIDLATRMKVSSVATSASSKATEAFLAYAIERFPFPVRSIQTDNGSEFAHLFERACEERGIPHYTSHPRCPKQNAFVERVIRTAIDEFYLFHETPVDIGEHAAALEAFDEDYNTLRPHTSLGYLTPMEYHERLKAADPPVEATP